MTIGNWAVGGPLSTYGFQANKVWNGQDGKYKILPAYPNQLSWNSYTMAHNQVRIPEAVAAPQSSNYTHVKLQNTTNGTWSYGSDAVLAARMGGRYSTLPSISPLADVWTSGDELKLLAKLLSKVKDHEFNLGVSLAEVDKFAGGVVSTVKQIAFFAWDVAHGRFEAAARRMGTYPPNVKTTRKLRLLDFSGRFLEMRYAWTPAVNDAFAAAQAFEALSNGPRKKIFRAGRRKLVAEVVDSGWTQSALDLTYSRSYIYEMYEELGALRQMGLGNPASILWERLPYSFVLDWFIPIGTYLELIGQIPYLKGRFQRLDLKKEEWNGYISLKTVGTSKCTAAPNYSSFRRQHYERTPISALSVPRPSFKVAGAVQGKRLQNALALSHVIFDACVTLVTGSPSLRKGRITYQKRVDETLIEKLNRL